MRDEFDSRLWVDHGAAFSKALAELIHQIRVSWTRLYEMQYDAPWRRVGMCTEPRH